MGTSHGRPPARPGLLVLSLILWAAACAGPGAETPVLTAEMPLHLEDHLDAATFTEISATDLPATKLRDPVEWRFDQPQPAWKATPQARSTLGGASLARTGDALQVTLTDRTNTRALVPNGTLVAGVHVDVADWNPTDWAEVVIRARADAASTVGNMGLRFNLRDARPTAADCVSPYQFFGENAAVIRDGTIHIYRLRALPLRPTCDEATAPGGGELDGSWRQLALWFWTTGAPGSIDLLSVTVVPKGAVPAPTTVEWRFDEAQPDWTEQLRFGTQIVATAPVERTSDALRVTLPEGRRAAGGTLRGGIYLDLPGWRREEWAHIIVRARTSTVTTMLVGLNAPADPEQSAFQRNGGATPIVSDGSVQTYVIEPDWGGTRAGPWVRLGLGFRSSEPGSIDVLSVSVIPITTLYAGDRAGARSSPWPVPIGEACSRTQPDVSSTGSKYSRVAVSAQRLACWTRQWSSASPSSP
jgi:hypothetical protein